MCSYYLKFGLGCRVATCWEIAAHSVDHMFSLYFDYLYVKEVCCQQLADFNFLFTVADIFIIFHI